MSDKTQVRERPILFSGEMIQAILDGRKTQTRRVVKFRSSTARALGQLHEHKDFVAVYPASESGWIWWTGDSESHAEFTKQQYKRGIECPYGKPGDRLWVRETWVELIHTKKAMYRADIDTYTDQISWNASIHMPRWASRITLEVVSVRVERVQDITEDDVLAEGVELATWGNNYDWPKTAGFAELWDSINAKRGHSWGVNPWVWVVEFRLLEVVK